MSSAVKCGWIGPRDRICQYRYGHGGLHSYEVPGNGLLHDRIHPTSGKLLAAHPLRPRTLVAEWWEVHSAKAVSGKCATRDFAQCVRRDLSAMNPRTRYTIVRVRRYRIEKEPTR